MKAIVLQMNYDKLYLEKAAYLEKVDIYALVRFWTQCQNVINFKKLRTGG